MGGLFDSINIISKPKSFGVDFSNSVLKIMQISAAGGNRKVAGWKGKKIPKGVIDSCEIKKPEDFKQLFKEALAEAKGTFKGRNIVLSIPEAKVFTRVIEIPLMKESEAEESVKWETESNIPISVDNVYYDWQILKKKKKEMEVLVMAVPKKIVDNYLEVFDKAGYPVVALEPESVANGRSIVASGEKDFSLIIDIGMDYSNFAIHKGQAPIFTANSAVCGKMFTDVAVKHFGTSFEKAESYKIKTGLGKTKKEKEEAGEVFKPVLETLIQDVSKTTEFFRENLWKDQKNKEIKKVILTGGGSNLKGLDAYLSSKLSQKVVLADPWVEFGFKNNIPPISKQDSQGFSTVIGLSLRARDHENYD